MSEVSMPLEPRRSFKTTTVGWLQVAAVVLLIEVGGLLGGLTGFVPLLPIFSVLVPLLAATWFLRADGRRWIDLSFGKRIGAKSVAGYTLLALAASYAAVFVLSHLLPVLDLPPADYSGLQRLLEGNLAVYLWFLIPVTWGSAAIGEELLVRGFLLYRLERLTGTAPAVVLQAAIFGLAHFYQGISGVLTVFLVGLAFGVVYVRCGRTLLPVILAHGVIDTVAVTLLYLGYIDLAF